MQSNFKYILNRDEQVQVYPSSIAVKNLPLDSSAQTTINASSMS